LSKALGQPVLIDNKPGGDGAVAALSVAKATPDGYTLMLGTATAMGYVPVARAQPPYDPISGFTPIGRVCESAFFLFAAESVPARSLKELSAVAPRYGGKWNVGSANAVARLAELQFAREANLDVTQVPYPGEARLFTDLAAGRVHFAVASGAGLPLARDGRLRVLATTLRTRSHLEPDVPTFEEAGFSRTRVTSWLGLFGPPGMPRDTIEPLSRQLRSVLSRPDVREQLEQLACPSTPSTPAELGAFVKNQLGNWREAMDAAGIRPQ
jgi:tripartite-type tricarboxylate transporter receptor subunit TctC